MAVRTTLQIGDPRLKKNNKKVTDVGSSGFLQLVDDLRDTMYDAGLIGIAAPQIGANYTVFVTEPRQTKTRSKDQSDTFRVFVNPEITDVADEQILLYEGCGSVLSGQLFGPVSRPRWITIRATDMDGMKFQFRADGILGRVIQHEYDHLLGVEFTEKVEDYRRLMAYEHYIAQIKPQEWHINNSNISIKEYIRL